MVHSPTNKLLLSEADQSILGLCEEFGSKEHISIRLANASFADSKAQMDVLFWLPQGCPDGTSVSVASSRLGQKLDEKSDWFDALRTLAVQISTKPEFLITAQGTTTDSFVRRIAKLFHIPLLDFIPFPKQVSRKWFEAQADKAHEMSAQSDRTHLAFFKPLHNAEQAGTQFDVNEFLVGIAKTAVLLSVSNNGNIHNAARRRLECNAQSGLRVLINRNLTPKNVESDLLARGATAWWLYGQDRIHTESIPSDSSSMMRLPGSNAVILTLDEIKTDGYLAHWTRRRVGPWPDQTNPEFLDDLIFLTSRRMHSELSALCRILASGRIIGSHDLTRARRDVVCFSHLPLGQLLEQRVFRPHLSRWDFEPYGIAIDHELLESLGAKPVVYGDEADWKLLSESEQAFFQLKTSKSSAIDWEQEREWRIVGDINLDDVPVDRAAVFVKSKSDASIVSGLSRWPVVILDPEH